VLNVESPVVCVGVCVFLCARTGVESLSSKTNQTLVGERSVEQKPQKKKKLLGLSGAAATTMQKRRWYLPHLARRMDSA
jgi:hypothetical protein